MFGIDEVMKCPGARRFRNDALFENDEMLSMGGAPLLPSVVEPTLTALEMQPGAEIPVELPLLPDEMTVAMPAERSVSMAAF